MVEDAHRLDNFWYLGAIGRPEAMNALPLSSIKNVVFTCVLVIYLQKTTVKSAP